LEQCRSRKIDRYRFNLQWTGCGSESVSRSVLTLYLIIPSWLVISNNSNANNSVYWGFLWPQHLWEFTCLVSEPRGHQPLEKLTKLEPLIDYYSLPALLTHTHTHTLLCCCWFSVWTHYMSPITIIIYLLWKLLLLFLLCGWWNAELIYVLQSGVQPMPETVYCRFCCDENATACGEIQSWKLSVSVVIGCILIKLRMTTACLFTELAVICTAWWQ